ncbi:AGC family protein kinase [Trichomonas vaginalis G3]|uniref:non-specific serine/threonine protein kinase n=1 Tax=Trichomonas vaginalis (strain ATCC PRA-98 / G3) TaxID=412133 RepID=A2EEG6_TRIV3|nr:protein serine/threonine kinase protein [Trichomonas vaginalis G3]EAY08972.1 AGC family protein kinase [Trichomonas vaginalis G3]KAI5508580.1 protein serine/threonine kinase protein [Trichomonas vaginalis G3]|eukprot:XP_001321195.1 AGC family protein kinase [Trichomonas vaginalis G3]
MNIPGFLQEKVLGKGSYGTVYKAKRIANDQSYAVKIVNTAGMCKRELEDSVNEIRLMASFNSPFIISFYEAFALQTRLCVITEYARLGDLSKLIDRRKRTNRPLLEDDIWRFLIQVTEGLRVLHEKGVVHRDIKSANLLLCAPDLVKIGDLGISTILHSHQFAKTQIGTPLYLAPEIWRRRPYDAKCDMWSLGVVLYEMLNFSFPFIANSTEELGRRILAGRIGPIRNGYSSEIQNIVNLLLQTNPDNRPSSEELMNMPCIKNRMHLIASLLPEEQQLLHSHDDFDILPTIKVPRKINQCAFPAPNYEDDKDLVRPMAERLHVKGGPATEKDADLISTRELMMVADHDWWSPKKLKISDEIESDRRESKPLSQRSPSVPPIIQQPKVPIIIQPKPKPVPRHIIHRQNDENVNPQKQPIHNKIYKPQPPAEARWPPANYYAPRPSPRYCFANKIPPRAYPPKQSNVNAAPRGQYKYVIPPWA